MKIFDNFLDEGAFEKLDLAIMGQRMTWHFAPFTAGKYESNGGPDQFFFGHTIYQNHTWTSGLSKDLAPLIQKIGPMALHMVRANLMTKSNSHVESEFHSDLDLNSPTLDKVAQWTTAIFYINDCDGYTKLETGEIIESRQNRLLTFPANIRHLGATCTNEKRRVLINLNYII